MVILVLQLRLGTLHAEPPSVPAFPGAEGFGAFTPGGRGGRVLFVTNLNDSGPGSLRSACRAEGPRTVIFRVSGTIELESTLTVDQPFITIAGQTAPGDGICLKNEEMNIATQDVVIRYLRFRPGDQGTSDCDALGGRNCRNVVIDHCSASWSVDECVSFYDCENVTVQWCLIAESLNGSHHKKGAHGYGGIWGGNGGSFHHNLLAHHASRNPRLAGSNGPIDCRNNAIYNWQHNSAYGGEGSRVNLVANYYKSGPATAEPIRGRIVDPSDEAGRWYVACNVVFGFPDISADNWAGGVQGRFVAASIRAEEPFACAPVRTDSADEAYERVLARAGAILPRRDAVDLRIVDDVRKRTGGHGAGGIIDSQAQVGGWPLLRSLEPPGDTDGDGMSDEWETAHGVDAYDPRDGPGDLDGDGYTNLEDYLNSIGHTSAP